MKKSVHDGKVLDSGDGYTIIDCNQCGFKHVNPLPDLDKTNKLYRDTHYDDGERDRLEYYERDRQWWLMNYGDILHEISKYVTFNKNDYLLDIGCGAGIFLEAAKNNKWNTVGIEISTIAAQHCKNKNLNIINDSFDGKLDGLPEKIKVIHMRNILEHIPDPVALIRSAYEKLPSGGLIVIGIPNDYNPLQKGLTQTEGYKPWWVAVPHHLNYFDYKSLESLVIKCGFSVAGRFTSFPIDIFLTMGDNYVTDPSVGKESHQRRINFENFMEKSGLSSLRRDLYRAFADLDLGREAMVFAIKP
jgi:SAM-dependent methyltransferase